MAVKIAGNGPSHPTTLCRLHARLRFVLATILGSLFLVALLPESATAQGYSFTRLLDSNTPRPDAAQSGVSDFGGYTGYASDELGEAYPITNGRRVVFYAGYPTNNSGLASSHSCDGSSANSIWSIPVTGGTPALLAGFALNLEPAQPNGSGTITCAGLIPAGDHFFFGGSYFTATSTTRQAYYEAPLAGGALTETLGNGDTIAGVAVSDPQLNTLTAGGPSAFLHQLVGPGGEQYLYQQTPGGISVTNVRVPDPPCPGGGGLSLYNLRPYATDGTIFAALGIVENLGNSTVPYGIYNVIVQGTGSLPLDCSGIVFSYPFATALPINPLPGVVGTPTANPNLSAITVAGGHIFVLASQNLADGTLYNGVFEVSGGSLVKAVGSNDAFPGIPLRTVQCRGYVPSFPQISEFTAAGNWVVGRVSGSSTAICSATQSYDSLQADFAFNVNTGVLTTVAAAGQRLDAAGDTVAGPAIITPGVVSPDGHLALRLAVSNADSTPSVPDTVWAIMVTNLNATTTATTTTLTTTPASPAYGSNVTLAANVASPGQTGTAPSGTVQFLDGTTALGSSVTLDGSGNASLTLDTLTAGSHSVTAVYSGGTTHAASTSSAATLTVAQGTTSLAFATSNSSVVTGAPITLTAALSVTSTGGAPTGSVQFLDGMAVLGTSPISNGSASLTISNLAQGSHSLTAVYAGDTNFRGATSAVITETVSAPNAAPTVTLAATPASGPYSQTVTITATETPAYGLAQGYSWSLYDGATALVQNAPSNSANGYSLTTSSLSVGQHRLTAVFSSTQTGYATGTSNAVNVTVLPASPTLAFSIPNQTFGAAPVTLAATSNSTGAITYTVVSGPATIAGATLTPTGAGAVTVQASQAAAGNYGAITGNVTFTVAAELPNIALAVANRAFGSAPFALAATSTSTGAITYSIVSGPATIAGSTLTLTGAGTVIVKASQAPAGNFAAATQNATFTVAPDTPSATLMSSAGSVLVQNSVTFTASISSPAGTPTGTVNFLDGAALIGTGTLTSGAAALNLSTLAAGSHAITVLYSGDQNFSSVTSPALTETVENFAFAAAAGSTTSETVPLGGTATYILSATPSGSSTFPSAIAFSVTGLPTGATATFSPAALSAGAGATNVTLTIVAPTHIGYGKLPSRPGRERDQDLIAIAGLILLPLALNRRGQRHLDRLVCVVVMLGASAAFVTGCGSPSVSSSNSAQPQTYALTVTAAAGSLTYTTSLDLTVQ